MWWNWALPCWSCFNMKMKVEIKREEKYLRSAFLGKRWRHWWNSCSHISIHRDHRLQTVIDTQRLVVKIMASASWWRASAVDSIIVDPCAANQLGEPTSSFNNLCSCSFKIHNIASLDPLPSSLRRFVQRVVTAGDRGARVSRDHPNPYCLWRTWKVDWPRCSLWE